MQTFVLETPKVFFAILSFFPRSVVLVSRLMASIVVPLARRWVDKWIFRIARDVSMVIIQVISHFLKGAFLALGELW